MEDISGSISFGSSLESLEPEKGCLKNGKNRKNRIPPPGSTEVNWTPRPMPSPKPSPENRELIVKSLSLDRVLTILTILTLADLRLSAFKSWADAEFGGVRAAFTVLDEDNSHDFNVREFIKMLRFYGFQGDCRALFSTLDCDGHGTLSLNEISFLDLWESPPPTPNRSKENFASRMSQMLPTKNTESETETKKEKMKKLPQVSPRLEELARSRHPRAPHRLPLLANASKSTLKTLDSSVAFSSASKARLQKSVYGSFSRTDGFLEEINKTAWRNFRVKVIKEEILSGHINEDFDFTPLDATFSKVKKKTIALRLRTIELLDKDNQDLRNCLNHSNSVDSLDP